MTGSCSSLLLQLLFRKFCRFQRGEPGERALSIADLNAALDRLATPGEGHSRSGVLAGLMNR